VNVLELPDLRNGYVQLGSWLLERGRPVVSRGLSTVELTGVTLLVPDPSGVMLPIGVNRKVNTRLAAVEALQLLANDTDPALILRAAPSYADVMVRPDDLRYGAYGPRLGRQLDDVCALLYREPDTRRAVLSIWREDDLTHDGDRPCTLTLQLLLRDDRLQLVVNMRSQDYWLGVPFDFFIFTQLQASVAAWLGVEVGPYIHHVGSLHLYDRDREAAGMLVMCPDDRPTPIDYPRGVVSWNETDYPTEVATYLLEGSCDEHEAAANPWYVRQLARLGVDQGGDDE
jgi:thymidylate synthase